MHAVSRFLFRFEFEGALEKNDPRRLGPAGINCLDPARSGNQQAQSWLTMAFTT